MPGRAGPYSGRATCRPPPVVCTESVRGFAIAHVGATPKGRADGHRSQPQSVVHGERGSWMGSPGATGEAGNLPARHTLGLGAEPLAAREAGTLADSTPGARAGGPDSCHKR